MIVGLAFAVAAAVVVLVGPSMARVADRLGEVTGMGGALLGAVFLALATDLPELALTTSAGITGSPKIAVGGLLGSAAAQLMFIALVDMSLRDGRLYRDVSVHTTLGQCALMAAVLTVPVLFAAANPTLGWVGVGTRRAAGGVHRGLAGDSGHRAGYGGGANTRDRRAARGRGRARTGGAVVVAVRRFRAHPGGAWRGAGADDGVDRRRHRPRRDGRRCAARRGGDLAARAGDGDGGGASRRASV